MSHCFNPPPLLDFSLCTVFWSSAISASLFGLPIEKYLAWSQTSPPEFWMKSSTTYFQLVLRTSSQLLSSSFHLPLKLSICTRWDWDETMNLTSSRAAHTVLCFAFGAIHQYSQHIGVLATAEQGLWSVMVFSLPPPAQEVGRGHRQDSWSKCIFHTTGCHAIKAQWKEEEGRLFVHNGICLSKHLLHLLRSCFLGSDWTFAEHSEWIPLLPLLAHAAFCFSYWKVLNYKGFFPSYFLSTPCWRREVREQLGGCLAACQGQPTTSLLEGFLLFSLWFPWACLLLNLPLLF